MVVSSLGLIGGKAVAMGLGFLFWLLAARFFSPGVVGLTAGAVSALMLCVQLASLGVGSAFIASYPRYRHDPGNLLDTALTLQLLAGVGVAGLFLVAAALWLDKLAALATNPVYAIAFLLTGAVGTVGILQDNVSMAQRRGDHVLIRNSANGAITLAPFALVPLIGTGLGSVALFAAWGVGAGTACALGFRQIAGGAGGHRCRARADRALGRRLVRVGLPNYALTLTEKAPPFILPIVVTELLSPAQNAYWYAAWMMCWGVYVIPISLGMGLYAEAAHSPEAMQTQTGRAFRSSLALGLPAALGLALLARPLLSVLGPGYAEAGTIPLRILVVGVVPLAVIQNYFGVCRARGQLREAITAGMVNVGLGLVGATLAARPFGLTGMAVSWLLSLTVTATWSGARLYRQLAVPEPAPGSLADGLSPASRSQHIPVPVLSTERST
jgi:O-antigen/teichoic acid export membrane protein